MADIFTYHRKYLVGSSVQLDWVGRVLVTVPVSPCNFCET